MQIKYVGPSVDGVSVFEGGYRYEFPYDTPVTVAQGFLDLGVLESPYFEAVDPEAEEYVPSQPGYYGPVRYLAANPDLLITGTVTYNVDGAPTSASLTWPEGETGTFTALTFNATRPALVDSYTCTQVRPSGTTTFTQPVVTRDVNGMVTVRPPLTISY